MQPYSFGASAAVEGGIEYWEVGLEGVVEEGAFA